MAVHGSALADLIASPIGLFTLVRLGREPPIASPTWG
jgi:hypothetical protein